MITSLLVAHLAAKRRSLYSDISAVCLTLSRQTKTYAATSMQLSVDHLNAHGDLDQAGHAATGWSTY